MLLFTSTDADGHDMDVANPLVAWHDLTFGDFKDIREADLQLNVPQSVRQNNGSWWMDVVLLKGGGTDLTGKGPDEVAVYRKRACRGRSLLISQS